MWGLFGTHTHTLWRDRTLKRLKLIESMLGSEYELEGLKIRKKKSEAQILNLIRELNPGDGISGNHSKIQRSRNKYDVYMLPRRNA